MKKVLLLGVTILIFAQGANAQVPGFGFDEDLGVVNQNNPFRAMEEADTLSAIQQPGNPYSIDDGFGTGDVVNSKFGDPNFWCPLDEVTQQPTKCVADDASGLNYRPYSGRERTFGGYLGTNSLQNYSDTSNAMPYQNAKIDALASAGVVSDSTLSLSSAAVGNASVSNAQFSNASAQAALQVQNSLYQRAALDPNLGQQYAENYDNCMRQAMLGKSPFDTISDPVGSTVDPHANPAAAKPWMAAHDQCMSRANVSNPFQQRVSPEESYFKKAGFGNNPNHLLNNRAMIAKRGAVDPASFDRILLFDFIDNQEIKPNALDALEGNPTQQIDAMGEFSAKRPEIWGNILIEPAASTTEKLLNPLAASGYKARPLTFPDVPNYKGPQWFLRMLIEARYKDINKLTYRYCLFQQKKNPDGSNIVGSDINDPLGYLNSNANLSGGAFWQEPEHDALLRRISLKGVFLNRDVIHSFYYLFRDERGSNGPIQNVNCKLLNPDDPDGPSIARFMQTAKVNYLNSNLNCSGPGCVSRAVTPRMHAMFKLAQYIGYGKFLGTAIQTRNQIENLTVGVVDRATKEMAINLINTGARSRDLDGDYAANVAGANSFIRELGFRVKSSVTNRSGVLADSYSGGGNRGFPGIASPGR